MEHLLTLTRIVLSFPIVGLILTRQYEAAFILYIIGALTDWFDGNLARKNNRVSNFGKLLDPYADKVFVILPLIALVDVNRVDGIWVILLTFRELSISFLRSLAVEKGVYMEASLLGKIKALLEFIAVSLLLLGSPVGEYILILSIIFAYLSAYQYLRSYLFTSF
ncbi:MAG: CDP-diacylglycerol--glycerol-3-phosphate 3-phosphatidyltransferase [Aquifex sp.]|nr:MAG: CDP-diacylglycerol--glycerol-3-phosphate 3-phosphatidyltransferase [Aquifex sp.]